VHLAIPQKDVFAESEQKPTASVLVATGVGRTLNNAQVQAVVHLVASSVEQLDPENVTVAGADGQVLAAGGRDQTLTAAGDTRSQQTDQYEQRLGGSVQRMLDQVVGPGHAVAQITADLDYDQTDTKTQTYVADPKTPPVAESKTTEAYTGNNAATGGVLGPGNGSTTTGNAGAYQKTSDTRNNAVGTVTETRRSAPGKVRRLGVAVLLDNNSAKNLDAAKVQALVSSAVGLDAKRGDTIAVTTMPFDQSAATAARKALADADKATQDEQLYSWVKTGGIGLAIAVLLMIAFLASRRKGKALLTEAELAQLKEAQLALEHSRMGVLEGGAEVAAAIEAGLAPDEARERRESQQKDIAELVEQQPYEVAQLLRTWLADQRSA
jgi:flagellar M-ring protein FliF